jgi:aminoglycoside phosphotransferase (APT) family kinase protein
MESAEARRAVAAAISTASALDLAVDDAVVLNDSNRLVARLLPCDVVARVSPMGWFGAAREVELVRRLADETDAPVAGLDPRVEPCLHERDGFEIAMWTYFDPVPSNELAPADYTDALERLHGALRQVDVSAPHFTDRLAEIRRWLADRDFTPELTDEDRELLADRIANPGPFLDGGAAEQLLHGEPHPGNVIDTKNGPLFFDFENCARGPVEFDLAWVPRVVSEGYRGADHDLIAECRGVVLALIAAHRWRRDDQHPSGRQGGVAFLNAVRDGPPWPASDDVTW